MIDYKQTLRLSNGREAEVVVVRGNGQAEVRIKGAYAPSEERLYREDTWWTWTYDVQGRWEGGRGSEYHLVNVDMAHELECEDWS